MAFETGISWCDSSHNFWTGCTKVSEGCKYCYMYRDKERYNLDPKDVIKTADATFYKPLKWKEPRLIFTCSWSDFFIEDADQWRAEAWKVIKDTPQHTWQILTKRPERIQQCLPPDWGDGYENVWLGISVENQQTFEDRMEYMFTLKAKTKFLSIEPILGRINLGIAYYNPVVHGSYHNSIDLNQVIDWIIVGGESGNNVGKYLYRTAEIEWFEFLLSQCRQMNIPIWVKQLGTGLAKQYKLKSRHGSDINEFDTNDPIRTRQFPKNYIENNGH